MAITISFFGRLSAQDQRFFLTNPDGYSMAYDGVVPQAFNCSWTSSTP